MNITYLVYSEYRPEMERLRKEKSEEMTDEQKKDLLRLRKDVGDEAEITVDKASQYYIVTLHYKRNIINLSHVEIFLQNFQVVLYN